MSETPHPDHEVNRASWDRLAAVHGQDAYYDLEGFVAGASSLIAEEEEALADVLPGGPEGRRVLHLQCHLGLDAITFARRGATVTGVDFSPVALARAAQLSARCGTDVEWVLADATRLPGSLADRFDLVWATMGIFCWIADLDAWMRSVATALAPGAVLVAMDGHPGAGPDRRASLVPGGRGWRRRLADGRDYATSSRTGPQVQYHYPLTELVAAAEAAGLGGVTVTEHHALSRHLCLNDVQRGRDGWFRHASGDGRPVLFTLRGRRQGPPPSPRP